MAAGAWALAQGTAKDDKVAVVELMHTILPKPAYEAMLDRMYTQMSQTKCSRWASGGYDEREEEVAQKEAVQECLTYDELVSWTGDVYTKHFTRKEIDDLAAFYKTPTGKKLAAALPTLSGEIRVRWRRS